MGQDGQAHNATLDCGTGRHTISRNIAKDGTPTGTLTFAFGRSNIALGGTLSGSGITFTNLAGLVNAGTINDVDLTGQVPLLHAGMPGSGNVNVVNFGTLGWWRRMDRMHRMSWR